MEEFFNHPVGGRKHERRPGENTSQSRLSVCLVTALTVSDFIDPELSTEVHTKTGAQLGVLTLAHSSKEGFLSPTSCNSTTSSSLSSRGSHPPWPTPVRPDQLCRSARNSFSCSWSRHLQSLSFDVFGFSSICSRMPLTLRLAREVKRLNRPRRSFSAATGVRRGCATMRAFPCVDLIVRGEADETFPAALNLLSDGDAADWEPPGHHLSARRRSDSAPERARGP